MRRILPAAILAVLCAAEPARALPMPQFVASAGHTAAVSGEPSGSGVAIGAAFLWPLDGAFAFGFEGFADDLGTQIGRLRDPNDPSIDLGAVSKGHRWSLGAAWRVEAAMGRGGKWTPYALASFGYYRIQDDQLGRISQASSGTGGSLGFGLRRALKGGNAIGLLVRYHQPIDQRVDHYLTAAADLRWRWGK